MQPQAARLLLVPTAAQCDLVSCVQVMLGVWRLVFHACWVSAGGVGAVVGRSQDIAARSVPAGDIC